MTLDVLYHVTCNVCRESKRVPIEQINATYYVHGPGGPYEGNRIFENAQHVCDVCAHNIGVWNEKRAKASAIGIPR